MKNRQVQLSKYSFPIKKYHSKAYRERRDLQHKIIEILNWLRSKRDKMADSNIEQ